MFGVVGMFERGVVEHGVDRGESVVAGGDGVVSLLFEMIEEPGDQVGVEVGDVQLRRRFAGATVREAQQESVGVPVGGDRVRAGLALPDEALGEEPLHGRSKRSHVADRL